MHGTLNSEYLVTHTTVSQPNSRVNNYITDYTIGQNPANNVYGNFLKDKNGHEIAQCVSSIDTDGSYKAGFWCNHNVEGNTTANGKWYLYVRTTPTAAYTYNFTSTSLYNNSIVDYTKPDETQGSTGSNIHQLWFRDKNLITCGLLECFSLNSSVSTTNLQSNRMTMRTYNNGKGYLDYLYDGEWLGCKVTKKQWDTYCGCIGMIRFHLATQHIDTDDITIKGMTLRRYNKLVGMVGPITFVNSIKSAKCANREKVTLRKLDIVNGKIVEL